MIPARITKTHIAEAIRRVISLTDAKSALFLYSDILVT